MPEWLDLGKPITLDDLAALQRCANPRSLDDLAACFADDDQLGDHGCACIVCADERTARAGESSTVATARPSLVGTSSAVPPPAVYTEDDDELLYRAYLIASGRDPDADPTLQGERPPPSLEVERHAAIEWGRSLGYELEPDEERQFSEEGLWQAWQEFKR